MVEVELAKIIIDEKRPEQVIVLKEKEGKRALPIVIGLLEASSIKMRLSGFKPQRPLTHDLMHSILDNLEVRLERVIIDRLENNTFFAKLIVRLNGDTKRIDARPSDSIALAVRTKSPIFVEEEVLQKSQSFQK